MLFAVMNPICMLFPQMYVIRLDRQTREHLDSRPIQRTTIPEDPKVGVQEAEGQTLRSAYWSLKGSPFSMAQRTRVFCMWSI